MHVHESLKTHALLIITMNALECRTLGANEFIPLLTDLLIGMTSGNLETQGIAVSMDYNNIYYSHVRFLQENGLPYIWLSMEWCWISATEPFRRKWHNFLTFVAHWVHDSNLRRNRHSRGEMWLNRHTQTDPTTVTLAVDGCRGLMNAIICKTVSATCAWILEILCYWNANNAHVQFLKWPTVYNAGSGVFLQ